MTPFRRQSPLPLGGSYAGPMFRAPESGTGDLQPTVSEASSNVSGHEGRLGKLSCKERPPVQESHRHSSSACSEGDCHTPFSLIRRSCQPPAHIGPPHAYESINIARVRSALKP